MMVGGKDEGAHVREPIHPIFRQWPNVDHALYREFVLNASKKFGLSRIIEFGCSFGLHLRSLSIADTQYCAVDYGYFVEFARVMAPCVKFIKMHYQPSEISKIFWADDGEGRQMCIINFRLEHVQNLERWLAELRCWVEKGNIVLIAIDSSDPADKRDVSSFYRRSWRAEEFQTWLVSHGFPVVHIGAMKGDYRSIAKHFNVYMISTRASFSDEAKIMRGIFPRSLESFSQNIDDLDNLPDIEGIRADFSIPLFVDGELRSYPSLEGWRPSPIVNYDLVRDKILSAKRERRPFSLIRLGNGEGRVLGFPDFTTPLWLSRSFRNWFGTRAAESEINVIRSQLMSAITESDIIGVRMPPYSDNHWKLGALSVSLFNLQSKEAVFCNHDFHLASLKSGFFEELIAGERAISVISCHPLQQQLSTHFGVSDVALYQIPGQAKFFFENDAPAHYPDVFNKVRESLTVRFSGEIFLVGAGPLGKIYCQWIKRAGGIALDVGSALDVWAGHATRSGYDKIIPKFRLAHSHHQSQVDSVKKHAADSKKRNEKDGNLKVQQRIATTNNPNLVQFEDIKNLLPHLSVDVILDVGANVGQSCKRYRHAFPKAKIFAFEPTMDTFAQLQARFSKDNAIECFQLALGDQSTHATIEQQKHSVCNRIGQLGVDAEIPGAVKITTGDAFCAEHKIDWINFLKIDTEGFDLRVCRGFREMLEAGKVDLIQVEAGLNPKNTLHVPFQDFKDYLEPLGYYIFRIYDQFGAPIARRCNVVFISSFQAERNRNIEQLKPTAKKRPLATDNWL